MSIASVSGGYKIGDVIGFLGRGFVSRFINLGTCGIPNWGVSHVAIVGEWEDIPILFESTTLNDLPCYITGNFVKGVQAHPIAQRIEKYDGYVWHYPLYRELYHHEATRLRRFLHDSLGTPYDSIGAVRSGGVVTNLFEGLLRAEDLSSVFCSELMASAFGNLGLYSIANASRWNPNKICRRLRKAGVLKRPVRKK